MARTRLCRYCRRWFRADPRLKDRQYACIAPGCQVARQKADERAWLERHPGYWRGRALKHRAWRRAHPEAKRVWRAAHPEVRERERLARKRRRRDAPLRRAVEQEAIALQLVPAPGDAAQHAPAGEQKPISPQALVLLGVVTRLPPAGEPKPIVGSLTACHDQGRRLLAGPRAHAAVAAP